VRCVSLQIVAAWQALGLCHGDIKPGNIVVDESVPDEPRVYLIDVEGAAPLTVARDLSDMWLQRRHAVVSTVSPREQWHAAGTKYGAGTAAAGAADGAGAPTAGPSTPLGVCPTSGGGTPPELTNLRVFTPGYVVPSSSGAVTAELTTDWYSLGCTLSQLHASVSKVRLWSRVVRLCFRLSTR
jgi:serine/threonine protein kinase